MSKIKKIFHNKEKKILIFFQSIADIREIIQLLNFYSFGKCVIIVTGGKHFCYVLKKLKVNFFFGAEIYAFHGLSLKNPINPILMYYKFYHSYDTRVLMSYHFEKAIFFSEYEDFIAPILLSRYNIKKIVLIDTLKNIFAKKKIKISFKNKLKSFVIRFLQIHSKIKISFYNFKYFTKKSSIFIQFPHFNLIDKKIYKIKPHIIKFLPKFQLKLKKKFLKKKNIMYIDSNDEEMIGDEFKVIMNRIFMILQKLNYNIIIKRPTRENLSPSLEKKINFNYISDPTPIELYDLTKIDCAFGFMTSALSKISETNTNIKVFSIINLLSIKKKIEFKKMIYNLHKNLKINKGKIYYPSNFKKVLELVSKKLN